MSERYEIPIINEEKATKEALKKYNINKFSDDDNSSRFEIIDNENIDNNLNNLEEKSNISIEERNRALIVLNELDKISNQDLDLAYDKETKLYHIIFWNYNKIINSGLTEENSGLTEENLGLTEENLSLVEATNFGWVDINRLEELIKRSKIDHIIL